MCLVKQQQRHQNTDCMDRFFSTAYYLWAAMLFFFFMEMSHYNNNWCILTNIKRSWRLYRWLLTFSHWLRYRYAKRQWNLRACIERTLFLLEIGWPFLDISNKWMDEFLHDSRLNRSNEKLFPDKSQPNHFLCSCTNAVIWLLFWPFFLGTHYGHLIVENFFVEQLLLICRNHGLVIRNSQSLFLSVMKSLNCICYPFTCYAYEKHR